MDIHSSFLLQVNNSDKFTGQAAGKDCRAVIRLFPVQLLQVIPVKQWPGLSSNDGKANVLSELKNRIIASACAKLVDIVSHAAY